MGPLEIRLTAASVASATSGAVVAGDPGRAFDGVSIDTRTLKAGELFFAIRGEQFDGAEFAGAAIEAGAAGIVVPHGWQAGLKARTTRDGVGDVVRPTRDGAGDVAQAARGEVGHVVQAFRPAVISSRLRGARGRPRPRKSPASC